MTKSNVYSFEELSTTTQEELKEWFFQKRINHMCNECHSMHSSTMLINESNGNPAILSSFIFDLDDEGSDIRREVNHFQFYCSLCGHARNFLSNIVYEDILTLRERGSLIGLE